MLTNTELFTVFVQEQCPSWDTQENGTFCLDGIQWYRRDDESIDPYDMLPACVRRTPRGNLNEEMMLMYGWATDLDNNDNRRRVRILIHFHNGGERMALQVQGEDMSFPELDDENNNGTFAETLKFLRLSQEAGIL